MRLSRYGIILEALGEDHLEMVRLWRNQEFVRCNMEYKKSISREQQEEWFAELNPAQNLYWVIRTHGYPIGLIHIKNIDLETKTGEAGVFIGEPSYLEMPQPMLAILFMMELAFYALGFKELKAKIRSGNERAIGFNTKLGYSILPNQPEGFQYYSVSENAFDIVTQKIRGQACHMYGNKTVVEKLAELDELSSEMVKGVSRADEYFNPKFT